jgi:uncharacterized pyridoxamine 5'-phosphate oxidase family protein
MEDKYYFFDPIRKKYIGNADSYLNENNNKNVYEFIKNFNGTYYINIDNSYLQYGSSSAQINVVNDVNLRSEFIIKQNGNIIYIYTLDNNYFINIDDQRNVYFTNDGKPYPIQLIDVKKGYVWILTSGNLSNPLEINYKNTICNEDSVPWNCVKDKPGKSGCVKAPCNKNDIPIGVSACGKIKEEYNYKEKENKSRFNGNYYIFIIILIIILIIFMTTSK